MTKDETSDEEASDILWIIGNAYLMKVCLASNSCLILIQSTDCKNCIYVLCIKLNDIKKVVNNRF